MARKPEKTTWFKEQILELINTNQLKPNDQLPGQNQMMEEYGVSYPIVYKGLKDLVQMGAIYRIKGKGTFVSETKVNFFDKYVLVNVPMSVQFNMNYIEQFRLIRDNLLKRGLIPLIHTNSSEYSPLKYMIHEKRVLGAIFFTPYRNPSVDDRKFLEFFLKSNLPYVFIDEEPGMENINTITEDHFQLGHRAASILIEKKCKRIGVMHFNEKHVIKERIRGMETVIHKKASVSLEKIEFSKFETLEKSVFEKLDGLFLTSEVLGMQVYHMLKSFKMSAPKDIQLITTDGSSMCDSLSPTLSSLTPPHEKISEMACDNLISMINKEIDQFSVVKLPSAFVARESTKG